MWGCCLVVGVGRTNTDTGVCWGCLLWVLLRYKDEQDRNETLQLNQVRKEERLELDMKEKNNRNLQQVAREYNSLLEIAKGHTQALGKRGRESWWWWWWLVKCEWWTEIVVVGC